MNIRLQLIDRRSIYGVKWKLLRQIKGISERHSDIPMLITLQLSGIMCSTILSIIKNMTISETKYITIPVVFY